MTLPKFSSPFQLVITFLGYYILGNFMVVSLTIEQSEDRENTKCRVHFVLAVSLRIPPLYNK